MTITDIVDVTVRLLAATGAGIAIGTNRELRGKPTGVRTLGIVALGSALIMIAAPRFAPAAISGALQGILTGVGFIGAGVILRDAKGGEIQGLTTAATVWLTAAIGIVCGLGDWVLSFLGVTIALLLLVLGLPFEQWLRRRVGRRELDHGDDDAHT